MKQLTALEIQKMYEEKESYSKTLGAQYFHSPTDTTIFILENGAAIVGCPDREYIISKNSLICVNGNSLLAIRNEIDKNTSATGYIGKCVAVYTGGKLVKLEEKNDKLN